MSRASGLNEKMKGVYIITFRDKSVYIGQSGDIKSRMKGHAADPFMRGIEKAKIEVMHECDEQQRKVVELSLLRAFSENGENLRNYSFSHVNGDLKKAYYEIEDCTKTLRPLIKVYSPNKSLIVKPFKRRKEHHHDRPHQSGPRPPHVLDA